MGSSWAAAALLGGLLHAWEPDHIAAVTTFVTQSPSRRDAWVYGLRWGLGHALAVLVTGLAAAAVGMAIPEVATRVLEIAVGCVLVGLGLRALLRWRAPAGDGQGATWVGVLHGLAGSAPLIAVLPAALLGSLGAAALYLTLFGVGTLGGMALYAALAGRLARHLHDRLPRAAVALRTAAGVLAVAVGSVWLWTAWRG